MKNLFEAIAEYMSAEGSEARRERAKKVRIEFDLAQDRIQEMQSRIKALEQFESAYKEWSDKTEWVQQTAKPKELGKHRADVLRERIEALEKDAARLNFLQTTQEDGEGLRYEVNCFVVDGENQFTIYDEVKQGFISGEWSKDFRSAIDHAMQSEKGGV